MPDARIYLHPMTFHPFEAHHGYLGIVLCAVAVWLIVSHHLPCLAWLLGFAGIVMVIDDCCEHFGSGYSPLYELFQYLWHKVFGKNADAIWSRIFGGL